MKTIIVFPALIIGLYASAAAAQFIMMDDPNPQEQDLAKAMAICQQHMIIDSLSPTNPPSPIVEYPQDWSACYVIQKRWESADELLKRDKEFVERVAK